MGFTTADYIAMAGVAATTATAALQKKPVMPPSPVIPQAQVDQSAQDANQAAQRRQSIAGGISSTVGTTGGQAGAVLNPGNMGSKTLLGQ
jgi:hypothetical protein